MTVASGLLFPVGLLSRLSFGRNGRQKPEADATAVERLFALADQTENSPSRKAVEARPSYCQEQQQRQAKGMRGSTAQNRQPNRTAHSLINPLPATLFHVPARLVVRVVKLRVVAPSVPREIPLPLREVPQLRPGRADIRLPRGVLLRTTDGHDTCRKHRRYNGHQCGQQQDTPHNAPLLHIGITAGSLIAYRIAPLRDLPSCTSITRRTPIHKEYHRRIRSTR